MPRVSIDRTYIVRSALFALLLLWPLLAMGRPSYMLDSGYYQNGGHAAVAFVANKLHIPLGEDAAGPEKGAAGQGDTKVVARAITYSVLAYVLKGPGLSMVWLAVFQALCAALTATALWMALAGRSGRGFAAMVGLMLFGTALAPLTGFMVPDIFAGIMLGILAVLPFYWQRFSGAMLALLVLMATLAISVHASHPPVAAGMALATSIVILLLRRRRVAGAARFRLAILWLPVAAGMLLTLVTGIVGFGEIGIAPKGFPLALARSLDNGPARWYLQAACAKDRRAYAMCEVYGTDIPDDVGEFLFKPGNVVNRSTPEQLDRIRAEERVILLRSAMRYPFYQAYIVVRDIPRQLLHIELDYLRYDGAIAPLPNGKVILRPGPDLGPWTAVPPVIVALSIAATCAVVASVAVLGWRWRRLDFDRRGVVLALAAGLLANAGVCAVFSGVAPRYQARLMWLVPFVALALAPAGRRGIDCGVEEEERA